MTLRINENLLAAFISLLLVLDPAEYSAFFANHSHLLPVNGQLYVYLLYICLTIGFAIPGVSLIRESGKNVALADIAKPLH